MTKRLKQITLDKAKKIIGTKDIDDAILEKRMQSIKIFCKVAYEFYQKNNTLLKSYNNHELIEFKT